MSPGSGVVSVDCWFEFNMYGGRNRPKIFMSNWSIGPGTYLYLEFGSWGEIAGGTAPTLPTSAADRSNVRSNDGRFRLMPVDTPSMKFTPFTMLLISEFCILE
ncbi:hypothetical protein OGAPHI_005091 [Ogataea philodendri]|uniref:Uncharacterized protein n=1 Tax=Ogataea philodendri TaxID=1378263 RepID=A0A9P8P1R4_9ASCO|nr:uncharacterized protein OGAPHI_005091 [Ogataea philodendri]KAH3663690.1 hypothetical protein OGAPHI_005091 [Ogataea philodendri]